MKKIILYALIGLIFTVSVSAICPQPWTRICADGCGTETNDCSDLQMIAPG